MVKQHLNTSYLLLLQALILKLKDPDPNPGVVISVLATIGELAQVRLVSWGRCHITLTLYLVRLSRMFSALHLIKFLASLTFSIKQPEHVLFWEKVAPQPWMCALLHPVQVVRWSQQRSQESPVTGRQNVEFIQSAGEAQVDQMFRVYSVQEDTEARLLLNQPRKTQQNVGNTIDIT